MRARAELECEVFSGSKQALCIYLKTILILCSAGVVLAGFLFKEDIAQRVKDSQARIAAAEAAFAARRDTGVIAQHLRTIPETDNTIELVVWLNDAGLAGQHESYDKRNCEAPHRCMEVARSSADSHAASCAMAEGRVNWADPDFSGVCTTLAGPVFLDCFD